MGKEAGRKHDQWPLSQMMRDLEAKNAEVGGILFSTVGKGDRKAFLFPTSVARKEREVMVNEFLVVTLARIKIIQVSSVRSGHYGQVSADFLSQAIIEAKDVGGYTAEGKYGEKLEFRFRLLGLKIEASKTSWRIPDGLIDRVMCYIPRAPRLEVGYYDNCRLANPNGDQAERVLNANIKRVEAMRATSQRVSQALGTVS